jgi:hypothetical protein
MPIGQIIESAFMITIGDDKAMFAPAVIACGGPGTSTDVLTAVVAPDDFVIGFAYLTIQWQNCSDGSVTLTSTPRISANATALIPDGLLSNVPPALFNEVLADVLGFQSELNALLVPVLVR